MSDIPHEILEAAAKVSNYMVKEYGLEEWALGSVASRDWLWKKEQEIDSLKESLSRMGLEKKKIQRLLDNWSSEVDRADLRSGQYESYGLEREKFRYQEKALLIRSMSEELKSLI